MQQKRKFGEEFIQLFTKHMKQNGNDIAEIFTNLAVAEYSIISASAPIADLTEDEAFAYYHRVLEHIRTTVHKKLNQN